MRFRGENESSAAATARCGGGTTQTTLERCGEGAIEVHVEHEQPLAVLVLLLLLLLLLLG